MFPWSSLPNFTHYPLTDGGQFWTDWLWRRGYRLQACAVHDRWRVVDPQGHGCLVGGQAEVQAEFDRLAGSLDDSDSPPHIAILLHGLLRTRRCMKPLEKAILKSGIAPVIRFDYASTRKPVAHAASGLCHLVDGLPRQSRISFVCHSMGNIVLRYAIGNWQSVGDPRGVLPRMHRVVMLGPPNQGALIARRLAKTQLFGWVVGDGGLSLGPTWQQIHDHLATPPCRFAIVAGDVSGYKLVNPLIAHASDLLVGVEEAKLEGADPFVVMPVAHGAMMTNQRVIEFTVDYLNSPCPTSS